MATLKNQIIMYRAKHNMSQRAFAAYAGISQTTLVHIETGAQKKTSKLVEMKIKLALKEEAGGENNEFV